MLKAPKRKLNPIQANHEIETLVIEAKELRIKIDTMNKQLEKMKVSICTYMTDSEDLVDSEGEVIVTWAQSDPVKRFDVKRFKSEQIELYKKYIVETLYDRRFLLK